MSTVEKTQAEMEKRLAELLQIRSNAALSCKQAGELDAIRYGLNAWNQYRRKRYVR